MVDSGKQTDVAVFSNGAITHVVPTIVTSSCQMDLSRFPFDTQSCILKYGSWSYDKAKVNLQVQNGAKTASLDGYSLNVEWDVLSE